MVRDVYKPDYLEYKEQEFSGNYDFRGRILTGKEFMDYFGPIASDVAYAAVEKVRQLEHADYLQVFCYGDDLESQKFYVMSGFEKGTSIEDYVGCDEFFVNVCLPDER